MTSLKDRMQQGKDARKQCSRSAQASAGKMNRDPIPLIKASSQGRVESLVELRYGRMLVSPFTFFRGNALLQAHDLSGTANMGLNVPICGDCHLMNFGALPRLSAICCSASTISTRRIPGHGSGT